MNTIKPADYGVEFDASPQLIAINKKAVPIISDNRTKHLLLKPPGTSIVFLNKLLFDY